MSEVGTAVNNFFQRLSESCYEYFRKSYSVFQKNMAESPNKVVKNGYGC